MQKIIVLHEPNVHRAEIESVGRVISEVRNDATKYYALLVDVPDHRVSLLSQICTCNEKHVKAIHDNYAVKAFFLDYPVQAELVDARQLLNVEPFWNQYGTKGKGIKVGVCDTGIDLTHLDFQPIASKVIASQSFVSDSVQDGNGHSTHVCSTIAGTGAASNGKYAGIAPDASLIVAKVLSNQGSGDLFSIVQGYNWTAQQGADIISLSLGGGPASCPVDDALAQAFDQAAQNQGIITTKASGNSGISSIDATVQAAKFSINVGASTKNKTIANFTSRRDADANCGNPRSVPDVYGIGVNLIAARSKDATIGTPLPENPKYMALSGTCLTEDAMVGANSIKDLKIGFPVPALYGIDTVLDIQNHGKQTVFQLTTKHGKSIEATGNHKFLVKEPQKTVWTPLATLKIGDRLVVESTSIIGGIPCPAYDFVKRIEYVGEAEVYDITTFSHNFIANGIVVHNSMGTPCVAGVCALLLSKFGKIEPVTLRDALIKAGARISL